MAGTSPAMTRQSEKSLVSRLSEAIADPVEGFDPVKCFVDGSELLAQPLDVAVDRPVVDVDLVLVGGIHQRVAALYYARTSRQRLEQAKLCYRQPHLLPLPLAAMALRVHAQITALHHVDSNLAASAIERANPAQHGAHPLGQHALRERFSHEVVGAKSESKHFVDFVQF